MSDTIGLSVAGGANSSRTLVSILNWNGTSETIECLRAIDRVSAHDLHFVVLDNGSIEDPSHRFAEDAPDVEFIRSSENLGFAGGHNLVMRLALKRGFGSVLLLNNDCQIGLCDIERMREMLYSDTSLGAVSPLIYRNDGSEKPMMVAGWFDWENHRTVRPNNPSVNEPPGSSTFLVGTAMLIRRSAITAIGLLDSRYFAYYEDNDISARLAVKGFRAVYCHEARCYHDYRYLHEYSPLALYLMKRNAWMFWRENTPDNALKGLSLDLTASMLLDLTLLKKHGVHRRLGPWVVAGFLDGFLRRNGQPPQHPRLLGSISHLLSVAPYALHNAVVRLRHAIV